MVVHCSALHIGLLLALGTASELLSQICKIQGSTLSLLSLVNPLPCHSHQISHEHGTTHLMRHAHDSYAMPCTTRTCEPYITHTNANTDSPFTLRHGPVLASLEPYVQPACPTTASTHRTCIAVHTSCDMPTSHMPCHAPQECIEPLHHTYE